MATLIRNANARAWPVVPRATEARFETAPRVGLARSRARHAFDRSLDAVRGSHPAHGCDHRHTERLPNGSTTTPNGPSPAHSSAVPIQRRYANKGCNLSAFERAEFGEMGQYVARNNGAFEARRNLAPRTALLKRLSSVSSLHTKKPRHNALGLPDRAAHKV